MEAVFSTPVQDTHGGLGAAPSQAQQGRKNKGPNGYCWKDPQDRRLDTAGLVGLVDHPDQDAEQRTCSTILKDAADLLLGKAEQFGKDIEQLQIPAGAIVLVYGPKFMDRRFIGDPKVADDPLVQVSPAALSFQTPAGAYLLARHAPSALQQAFTNAFSVLLAVEQLQRVPAALASARQARPRTTRPAYLRVHTSTGAIF